ncbi:MBL fold metallo-hydrolase [Novosphingobium malaysiense]|uniref:MBL fold metallo-hydrolase n=1 Tax=Novosphingobium malaysiense TaxID=1348853 RepID=UPI00068B071C|nr:MBL fold metallo-hydrolase [Novosphingobium malaysiense]
MEFEILPVTRFEQNCSIVWCEETRRAAVIDPGGDIPEIVNFIELLDLEPEVVLVTHGHFDHCGGAAQFAALTGVRIEGPHREDAHLLRNLAEQPAFHAARAAAQAGAPLTARDIAMRSAEGELPQPGSGVRSFTPDRWLEHGDRVRFGKEELEVLHCPGHTHGHVAYYNAAGRRAFVGDILFRHTIGAWEHPDGDLKALVHSIREKLFVLGDDVAFVPGHGDSSTFGHEREANPFVSDAAFARWRDRLARPSS